MSWRDVRPVALAVVRRDGRILLAEHYDPAEDYTFYRPVGGAIEFGEHSRDAVRREFREELGVELTGVRSVDTYERTFTFDGTEGHEIWRLYEADIVEDWPYELDRFEAEEPELGEAFDVVWKEPAAFAERDEVVYPPSLLADL
ncbi:NUDIX hydrolase [Halostella litorea]|uniref:NUDIX hydrolase n=1 Tax=Halostella litorea TaxID=2528831 RepID=UPI001093034A|nr:NUDIX domain-containing protein [Halostella litorea]